MWLFKNYPDVVMVGNVEVVRSNTTGHNRLEVDEVIGFLQELIFE